jgi:hypothetical protein
VLAANNVQVCCYLCVRCIVCLLNVIMACHQKNDRPTEEEQALVPHHLIDVLPVDEQYTAGDFARDAREVIADVISRGKVPIVVGGEFLARAIARWRLAHAATA